MYKERDFSSWIVREDEEAVGGGGLVSQLVERELIMCETRDCRCGVVIQPMRERYCFVTRPFHHVHGLALDINQSDSSSVFT